MMRKILPVVFAGVLLTSLVSTSAHALPWGIRLSEFGDAATSVGVGWNSDDATDVEIQYGTSANALNLTATVSGAEVVTQAAALGFSFSLALENLTPNTTYFYKVGRTGAFTPEGEPHAFTTLPADSCASFRAVVLGDNRSNVNGVGASAIYPGILEAAIAANPNVLVNTGDMVKNGEAPEEWRDFLEKSEAGFSRVASIPTMGNHDSDDVDGDAAIYNQIFRLPRNDVTESEDYYSIDIGPIHFVSLNSQFTNATELPLQAAWLDADLAATSQPWKIIFFHKAIYTRGNHTTGEEDDGALNAAFIPVFDAHDVDLVLNGHSHDYERYVPSLGVDADFGGAGRTFPDGNGAAYQGRTEIPPGEVGTTYIVTGGGGAATLGLLEEYLSQCTDPACTFCTGINLGGCPADVLEKDRDGTVVFDGDHHFIVLDVNGGVLSASVQSTDSPGTILDAWSMTKDVSALGCDAPDAGVVEPEDAGAIDPEDAGGAGPDDAGATPGEDGGTPSPDTPTPDAPSPSTPGPAAVGPEVATPEGAPSIPTPEGVEPEPTPTPPPTSCGCEQSHGSSSPWETAVALSALCFGSVLLRRRSGERRNQR